MAPLAILLTLLVGQVPSAPDSRYEVHLLTMDQGDEVWEQFGHNALLIRDGLTGEELAWNWGLFNFEDVDFLPRFLRGTMRYTMGPMDPDALVASYVAYNRSVYAHRIHLSDEEAAELDAFVRWNFLPENRAYIYHYFLDNCSTRIRDALDGVLGGLLQDTFADRQTSRSFRWHARRLVQGTTWIDQGLSFLLGLRGDRPITEWEAMFIPMELMTLLEEMERPDGAGGSIPLLGQRVVLFESDRPATPAEAPPFRLGWVILGLLPAGLLAALSRPVRNGRRWAQVSLGATVASWGAFAGLLGTLLVLAWFTDHDFIQVNLNLFYLSPLALLLPFTTAVALLGSGQTALRAGLLSAGIAVTVAFLSVVASILQLTPLLDQGNGEVIAVALPVNLSFAWLLVSLVPVLRDRPSGLPGAPRGQRTHGQRSS
jgi:hypothetical protein